MTADVQPNYIQSHNGFPDGGYDNDLNKCWDITWPTNARLIIEFHPNFVLETCYDTVSVYGDPVDRMVLLRRYCGNPAESPRNLAIGNLGYDNRIRIKFISDPSTDV